MTRSLYEAAGGAPAMTALAAYSGGLGTQAEVVEMHCVEGEDLTEMGRRFLACLVAAMDDAALPADPALREAMTGYMRWAVRQFTVPGAERPAGDGVPRWAWDGLRP